MLNDVFSSFLKDVLFSSFLNDHGNLTFWSTVQFQDGGFQTKNLSAGGVWIFAGTAQYPPLASTPPQGLSCQQN